MSKLINKLSVILPYHHENYESLIEGINKIAIFLQNATPFEIIISQNGNPTRLKNPYPFTKIAFDKKKGLGRAIKNAVEIASGDYFYFLSLEIPFNFTDLKQMIKIFDQYDLIIGSKLHPTSVYKINFIRKISSFIASNITSLVLPNFNIRDPNGTLFGESKIFRELCKRVASNDYFFNTEFVYQYIANHMKVVEIPVVYIKEDSHSSVSILKDGYRYLSQVFHLCIRSHRS